MDKEEAIKRIRELEDNYNYWFEVFRRSTNLAEEEKARNKYKEAIDENIMLQTKYDLRVPPRYSSLDRAEMHLDEKNETLILSEKQLKERIILEDFSKEKKALEEDIVNNLKERKSEYIKEILDRISSTGITSEKRTITENLDNLGFFKTDSALSIDAKIELLSPYIIIQFERFLSGEMYIEDLNKTYREAVETYKIRQIKRAEDLFQGCINMLEKAAESSVLRIGKSYFELRIERLMSDWELATKAINDQVEHERRQHEIKDKVLGLIANNSGILQTEIYQLFNNYVKEEIREALYFLEKEKRISREKTGNTYRLFKEA